MDTRKAAGGLLIETQTNKQGARPVSYTHLVVSILGIDQFHVTLCTNSVVVSILGLDQFHVTLCTNNQIHSNLTEFDHLDIIKTPLVLLFNFIISWTQPSINQLCERPLCGDATYHVFRNISESPFHFELEFLLCRIASWNHYCNEYYITCLLYTSRCV